jgi:hypothetical protein
MSNPDLEAGMLELALQETPADADTRFKLAYLYRTLGRTELSALHYGIRVKQDRDAVALNNLAVAYEEMKLPAEAVKALMEAKDKNDLAKANMAHRYS